LYRDIADNPRKRSGNIEVAKLRLLLGEHRGRLFGVDLGLRNTGLLRLDLSIYHSETRNRCLIIVLGDIQLLTADDAVALKPLRSLELNFRQLQIRFACYFVRFQSRKLRTSLIDGAR